MHFSFEKLWIRFVVMVVQCIVGIVIVMSLLTKVS